MTSQAGQSQPAEDAIRREALTTFGPRVMKLSGTFAGVFRLDYDVRIFQRNYRNPVLVAAQADASAKMDLALQADRLADQAQDGVAWCVNDMLSVGAEPLFLLHHVHGPAAAGARRTQIVRGLAEGCRQAGCALLSGAGTPLPPEPGCGDLATFAVGVCDHRRMITGEKIDPLDEVIGLAGQGLHGAAFDVARRFLLERRSLPLQAAVESLDETVADLLLRPARIYAGAVLRVLRYYRRKRVVSGLAHVHRTGLVAGLERILPEGCRVQLDTRAWTVPPTYPLLEQGGTPRDQLRGTCDLGIGFVMIVRPAFTQSILKQLRRRRVEAWRIGQVVKGPRGVDDVA